MICRLCKKPLSCDHCDDSGEVLHKDYLGSEYTIECPHCNNLHAKCFAILNSLIEKWQEDRRAKTILG